MAVELIEEIVGKKAIEDIQKLTEALQANLKVLNENIGIAKQFERALNSAKTVKDLKNGIDDLAKAQANLAKSEATIIKLEQEKIKAQNLLLEQQRKASQLNAQQAKEKAQQARDTQRLLDAEIKAQKQKAIEDAKAQKNLADLNNEYKQLKKQQIEAANEAKRLGIAFGTNSKEFITARDHANELRKQLFAVEKGVGEFQRNVGNYPTTIGGIISQIKNDFTDLDGKISFSGENFKSFAKTAAGVGASIGLFSLGAQAKDANIAFEDTANELKAITGVAREDFNKLKDSARETSKQTRFSSVEILESFKLIGSAKPELLQNVEGLKAVKDASVLLAQASSTDLPTAVENLTQVLNQYGASANEASFYVDTLAAGAKFGAAEVPAITSALLEFGTQAKTANVSINESVGLIELLAEKGIQGAEAGTKLRNVMLTLNAAEGLDKKALASFEKFGVDTKVLSDATLPLEVRLKELSKVQNDSVAMLNIFGKENFNAGQIILQNVPRYAELAKQVQATGVAQEQASINSESASNALAKMKNAFTDLLISDVVTASITAFATVVAGLLGNLPLVVTLVLATVSAFTYLAVANAVATQQGILYQAVLVAQRIGQELLAIRILATTAATTVANAVSRAYAATQLAMANATGIAAVAVSVLRGAITLLSGPIGVVIGVAALLVSSFKAIGATSESTASSNDKLTKSVQDAAYANERNTEVMMRAKEAISDQVTEIAALTAITTDTSLADEMRHKALNKLIEISPLYKSALQGEAIQIDKVRQVSLELTRQLYAQAEAKAQVDLFNEATKKKIEAQGKIDALKPELENKSVFASPLDLLKDAGEMIGIGKGSKQTQFANAVEARDEASKTSDYFLETIKKNKIASDLLTQTGGNANKSSQALNVNANVGSGNSGGSKGKGKSGGANNNDDSAEIERKRLARIEELKKEAAEKEKERLAKIAEAVEASYQKNYEAMKTDAEIQAENSKKILDNDKATLEAKLQANTDYFLAKSDLIGLEEAKELKASDMSEIAKDTIHKKYAQLRLNQLEEFNKNKNDIIKSDSDKEVQLQLSKLDKQLEATDKANAELVIALQDQYSSGLISREEYEKRLNKLVHENTIERLEIELNEAQKQLQIANLTGEQKIEIQKRIDKIRGDLAKEKVDFKNNTPTDAENFTKQLEKYKQYQDAILEISNTIGEAVFNAETARIDAKEKRQNQYFDNEKKAIENSTLSATEKANRIKRLDAEQELQKKKIDRERITAERKKAAFEKASAVLSIGINTAIAVSKAVAQSPLTFGLPWSAFAAVTGAVQLAAALAKPLPQYYKGREGGPAEMAIVGDRFGTEIIESKDGTARFTKPYASLEWLKAGDRVIPNNKIDSYLKTNPLPMLYNTNTTNNTTIDNTNSELLHEIKGLRQDAKNKQTNVIINGDISRILYTQTSLN